MRIFFKSILSAVFITLFLLLVLLLTTKFKFLNTTFWENKYDLNFYKTLISSAQEEDQDLQISPTVAKQFADKNIENTISYLNGNNAQFLVYIPAEFDLNLSNEEIPLRLMLQRYTQIDNQTLLFIDYAGATGFYVTSSIVILAVLLIFLSLVLKKTVGVVLIISSLLLFLLSLGIEFIKTQWIRDLIPQKEGIALLTVPLIPEIAVFWNYIAISTLVVGIILLILGAVLPKKSSNTHNHKAAKR